MDEHEHLEMQESCQVRKGTQNLILVNFTGKKRRKKREEKTSKLQNCANEKANSKNKVCLQLRTTWKSSGKCPFPTYSLTFSWVTSALLLESWHLLGESSCKNLPFPHGNSSTFQITLGGRRSFPGPVCPVGSCWWFKTGKVPIKPFKLKPAQLAMAQQPRCFIAYLQRILAELPACSQNCDIFG